MKAFPIVALSRVSAQPNSVAGQCSLRNALGQERVRLGAGLAWLAGIAVNASLISDLSTNYASGAIFAMAAMVCGYLVMNNEWKGSLRPATDLPHRIRNHLSGRNAERMIAETHRRIDGENPCEMRAIGAGLDMASATEIGTAKH
jgi:hypothetical protein